MPPEKTRTLNRYDFAWILVRPWAYFVDRLPRLRALRAGPDGVNISRALEIVYPEMSDAQRLRLMRANLRQRAYNLAFTILVSNLGRFAVRLARAIPIVDREGVADLLDGDRPLLLVTFHTGPQYLLLVAMWRALSSRNVFVMHQDGNVAFREIERLLARLGARSIPNTPMAIRTLIRELRGDGRSIVMFGCDYAPGKQIVSFLGHRIRAAEGMRLVRDASDVDVICAVWERPGFLPRVRFTQALASRDASPEESAEIVQRAFDELTPIVERAPHRWTAWETFVDRIV